MKTTRGAQVGFSLIKVLVIAVALAVGGAGWYVYRHHEPKPAANTVATTEQPMAKLADASTAQPAQPAQAATRYLTITQWNVQLPLSGPINDAYYVVPPGETPDPDGEPSGIIVGVHSLDSSCGAVTSDPAHFTKSLGEIVRTQAGLVDPVTREPYTQEYPNGVTIGGYYYGFLATGTSRTCASATSNLQSVDSAFETATKDLVTATATSN